ncbi:MAG: hypothetical protein ACKOE2_01100 [Actinomycetales bacterium]
MRNSALFWLQAVLVALLAYSMLLVFAGSVAGSLFSSLGFGPGPAIDSPELQLYLRLPYMVLGAVMAGWTLLMIQLFNVPFAAALGLPIFLLRPRS